MTSRTALSLRADEGVGGALGSSSIMGRGWRARSGKDWVCGSSSLADSSKSTRVSPLPPKRWSSAMGLTCMGSRFPSGARSGWAAPWLAVSRPRLVEPRSSHWLGVRSTSTGEFVSSGMGSGLGVTGRGERPGLDPSSNSESPLWLVGGGSSISRCDSSLDLRRPDFFGGIPLGRGSTSRGTSSNRSSSGASAAGSPARCLRSATVSLGLALSNCMAVVTSM